MDPPGGPEREEGMNRFPEPGVLRTACENQALTTHRAENINRSFRFDIVLSMSRQHISKCIRADWHDDVAEKGIVSVNGIDSGISFEPFERGPASRCSDE